VALPDRPDRGIVPGLLQGAIVCALALVSLAALPFPVVPHAEIASSSLGSALLEWGMGTQASVQRWWAAPSRPDHLPNRADQEGSASICRSDDPRRARSGSRGGHAPAGKQRATAAPPPSTGDGRAVAPGGPPAFQGHARARLLRARRSGGPRPFERLRAAGIGYLTAGENLAFAPNLSLAHSGLMNSPGHRANILRPAFHHIGIGALRRLPTGSCSPGVHELKRL